MRYWPQKPVLGTQINWGDPLARGIVACWLMNEGSGNKVYDLSGNGKVLTPVSANPTWVAGNRGHALSFASNIDDRLNTPIQPVYSLNYYTVLFWVYKDISASGTFFFVDDNNQIFINKDTGTIELYEGGRGFSSADSIDYRNAWHMIGYCQSGDRMDIIADGKFIVASQNNAISPATWGAGSWQIGGYSNTTNGRFSGQISHGLICFRALTATEIMQLYMTPFRMFQEGF